MSTKIAFFIILPYVTTNFRAATDQADPDLLATRIRNSRSGSFKEFFTTKFSTKLWAFKICSLIFDKIFSSKAILNFFLICYSYVRMLKNCKINGLKAMNFGGFQLRNNFLLGAKNLVPNPFHIWSFYCTETFDVFLLQVYWGLWVAKQQTSKWTTPWNTYNVHTFHQIIYHNSHSQQLA